MSRFLENDEYDPNNFVETEHGFVLSKTEMPRRHDVIWRKLPEGDLYFFDANEWVRLSPPDRRVLGDQHLNHG